MQKNNNKKQRKAPKRQVSRALTTGGQPFPVSKNVVLPYTEVYSFVTTASTLQSWYYYQTSAYDPRGSLGGHQPLYFDQMSALYNRCRVDRVDYELSITSPSSTGHTVYFCAMPSATFETNVELLEERPWITRKQFNAGGGPAHLRGTILPWQVLGIPKSRYLKDDQFSATIGSNPTLMAYMIPFVYSGSGAGSTTVDIRVRFKYYVHFFELARPGSS